MRFSLLWLGIAITPLVASANTPAKPLVPAAVPPAPDTISISPTAQLLLQRATSTLKNIHGLHFVATTHFEAPSKPPSPKSEPQPTLVRNTVDFQKPGSVRIVQNTGKTPYRFLADGRKFYTAWENKYTRDREDDMASNELLGNATPDSTTEYLGHMLDGISPITALKRQGKKLKSHMVLNVTAVAPRDAGYAILSGVRLIYSFQIPKRGLYQVDDTLWFGPDYLLCEVQSQANVFGKKAPASKTVLSDVEINPAFANSTFTFNTAGLIHKVFYDPRLKVGTVPYSFQRKSLAGQSINLPQYKGKVLIIDVWATWCGPCVASLPELQAVYKKYHPQGLEVVSISLDVDKKALTQFIHERHMSWPQVFEGQKKKGFADRYGIEAIPFMMIVGKDGKIASLELDDDLDSTVKKILATA